MFSGHHEHSLDSQGRVAVPAAFRSGLCGGDSALRFMLTENYDAGPRCLLAYPGDQWQFLAGQLDGRSPFDENVIRLRRLIFGGAFECGLDRQGRVVVPPEMREYAGFGKQLVWVGAGPYAELWERERWRDERARVREIAAAILATLGRVESPGSGGAAQRSQDGGRWP